MANLKEIRNRIGSTKNTQKITSALKMVSAAKLRRAQQNIVGLRPYARGFTFFDGQHFSMSEDRA